MEEFLILNMGQSFSLG